MKALLLILLATIPVLAQDDLYGDRPAATDRRNGKCNYEQNGTDRFTGQQTVSTRAGQLVFIAEGDSLYVEASIAVISIGAAMAGGPLSASGVSGMRGAHMPKGTPFYIALFSGPPLKLQLHQDAGVSGNHAASVLVFRCPLTRQQTEALAASAVSGYRAEVSGITRRNQEDDFSAATQRKSAMAAQCLLSAIK